MKKKIISIVCAMALLLTACGGSAVSGSQENTTQGSTLSKNDTNTEAGGSMTGKYNIFRFGQGETAVDGDLLVASGMSGNYIELKADHTGVYVMSGTEMNIEWTESGDISTSGVKLYTFTVEGDVLLLDMMGTTVAFVRDGSSAPASLVENGGRPAEEGQELIPVLSARAFDIYYIWQVESGGSATNALDMGMDPGNSSLQVNKDGSGTIKIMGNETNVNLANGKISVSGMDLYTYTVVSADEIDVDMMGMVYKFLKEGSQVAADAGLVDGAVGTVVNHYSPKPGELQADFPDGELYYTDMRKTVEINYISTDKKNLYIPESIDGKSVSSIRQIGGTPENIYFPSCLKELTGKCLTNLSGVKSITFGNDDEAELALDLARGEAFTGLKDLETITFRGKISEDFGFYYMSFSQCYRLRTINGGSDWFKENMEFCKNLTEKDPTSFIVEQPAAISNLAKEITKNARSDKEKLYEINKWMVYNIDYDPYPGLYTGVDGLGNPCVDVWLPLDVLDYRLTYCQGYANLTTALCQAAGIPAVSIAAKCNNFGGNLGHQWTAVYIDGNWFSVDNTYSDCWVDEELVAKITPREKISTYSNERYEDKYPTPEDIPMTTLETMCLCTRFQPFVNKLGHTQEGFIYVDPTHDTGKTHFTD